jgi:hypothetical protein
VDRHPRTNLSGITTSEVCHTCALGSTREATIFGAGLPHGSRRLLSRTRQHRDLTVFSEPNDPARQQLFAEPEIANERRLVRNLIEHDPPLRPTTTPTGN